MNTGKRKLRQLQFNRFQSIQNNIFLLMCSDVDIIFNAFNIENIFKIDSVLLTGRFYEEM